MNPIAPPSRNGEAPSGPDAARLRRASRELEGIFLAHLFRAMRATVRRGDGVLTPSAGEELMTEMLDDRLAADAARRMERGVGEALFRQLQGRLAATRPQP